MDTPLAVGVLIKSNNLNRPLTATFKNAHHNLSAVCYKDNLPALACLAGEVATQQARLRRMEEGFGLINEDHLNAGPYSCQ